MDQRHPAAHRSLEAEPDTSTGSRSQEFGAMRCQQHLVGRHDGSAALNRLADPLVRGIDATDHLDDDVGRRVEDFVVVFSPDDRGRYPLGALA